MIPPKDRIEAMIAQLDGLIDKGSKLMKTYTVPLANLHPDQALSAENLVYYLNLRAQDIRELQQDLGDMGVSRLGKAESHVKASMLAVRNTLSRIIDTPPRKWTQHPVIDFKMGDKLLEAQADALFGPARGKRQARIMVTLPSEAATNYKLIEGILRAGAELLRINCAHDGPTEWKAMIDFARQASEKLNRPCRICMDLGGPKIRTGSLVPGPPVVRLRPTRNELGEVTAPVRFWLGPAGQNPPAGLPHIPVTEKFLKKLETGFDLAFVDARQSKRRMRLVQEFEGGFLAQLGQTAYLIPGIQLRVKGNTEISGEVGTLPPLANTILLKTGDTLILHRDPSPGEPAKFDEVGILIEPAHVSCSVKELYRQVKPGEPVRFDDGKIEGQVTSVTEDEIEVLVTFAKPAGSKLAADKGINFPASKLDFGGLTEKDQDDLHFIAAHADVVNVSFVNDEKDIDQLLGLLKEIPGGEDLGIILKIETLRGVQHLAGILLRAMQHYPVGVMIARGDLAVETGWNHLAHIQEEILRLCEAAHIPIVWATQVLENLAKKGLPSRAEITDAAAAQRAECVMLNKGPYIVEAIRMLDEILTAMQDFNRKQSPLMPRIDLKQP